LRQLTLLMLLPFLSLAFAFLAFLLQMQQLLTLLIPEMLAVLFLSLLRSPS